ncbi:rhodanese-like domain-containing protein [Gordonia amicalis]|uniref:rhodanese-like domain-containing protein n=1 Tax=Gordonia amicalis TaxID=89053 RepID=UPI002953C77F|nr:rhodanese-like domain-containing protein [Gordonia amicalis]MDV7174909.1 rhodanese-like domain-containing protein [Gordonia amicalis]
MEIVTMGDITQVPVTDLPDDFTGTAEAVILDVREPDEWANGYIRGAVHIPMAEIPGRLGEIDPDADLYVVCRSSGRSMRVLHYLAQVGYDGICVRGGMLAWQEHGKPVEFGGGNGQGNGGGDAVR